MKDFVQYEFITQSQACESKHFYVLLYVLKGKMEVITTTKKVLYQYDVLVIDPHQSYDLNVHECCAFQLQMNAYQLFSYMNGAHKHIQCDSTKKHTSDMNQLCYLLDHMLTGLVEQAYPKLNFYSYAMQIIKLLIDTFSMDVIHNEEETRKIQIEDYIHMNYQSDLSLEELAHHFHLSVPYFAKYFKEMFGTTYLKYVNTLRVESAANELLRRENTVLRIALEHGFPNLTSFHRVFKETYGCTPKEYQCTHKPQPQQTEMQIEAVKQNLALLKHHMELSEHHVSIDLSKDKAPIKPYWFELCNLGCICDVLKDGVKDQIRQVQRELGFRYARIGYHYDNAMKEQFYEEENVFDFLFELKFQLWISIDVRSCMEKADFFQGFTNLLYHCINRYGHANVNEWRFEVTYDTDFTIEKAELYRVFYQRIAILLKEAELNTDVFGPGLLLKEDGENLKQFLKVNQDIHHLTIAVAPYSLQTTDDTIFINRVTNPNYILDQNQLCHTICESFPQIKQIYIIAWKESLNDVDLLNDSGYRGASILSNFIKGYGVLNSLPLDISLDLLIDDRKNNHMLSGLSGLISRKGIKKPAFYAFKFLKKMDDNFLYQDDSVLASCSNQCYIQIICHNCKTLNHKYYAYEAGNTTISDIDMFFDDHDILKIRYDLTNLKNGNYLIKYRTINEEEGNPLKKWQQMKFQDDSFYGIDELDYLKSIAKPSIKGEVKQVKNGSLSFICELTANEMKHIHILYMHE